MKTKLSQILLLIDETESMLNICRKILQQEELDNNPVYKRNLEYANSPPKKYAKRKPKK